MSGPSGRRDGREDVGTPDTSDWRRDEGEAPLGAEGDSDDVADSPTKGGGPEVTPGQGDSDDLADDTPA